VATRELWSGGGGRQLSDLVASALLSLLLRRGDPRPVYFCSPWVTNFSLANNAFGQFAALLPDLIDDERISFAQYLVALAETRPVRVVTTEQRFSSEFLALPLLRESKVVARTANDAFHEKGILATNFYVEGSMNLTHNGVHVNGEKVSYHSGGDADGDTRIARAYLEFDRKWDLLNRDA
jgi:hypothetical protein